MAIGGVGNSDLTLPVAVELDARPVKRRWLVTFKGRVISRHVWRESAIYRAKQMQAALNNGTAPEGEE